MVLLRLIAKSQLIYLSMLILIVEFQNETTKCQMPYAHTHNVNRIVYRNLRQYLVFLVVSCVYWNFRVMMETNQWKCASESSLLQYRIGWKTLSRCFCSLYQWYHRKEATKLTLFVLTNTQTNHLTCCTTSTHKHTHTAIEYKRNRMESCVRL